jgi:hypothetical protein
LGLPVIVTETQWETEQHRLISGKAGSAGASLSLNRLRKGKAPATPTDSVWQTAALSPVGGAI